MKQRQSSPCIQHLVYPSVPRRLNVFSYRRLATIQSPNHNYLQTLSKILKDFLVLLYQARVHLISGAVARGISIFVMYPVDTLKTRLQVERIRTKTSWNTILHTLSKPQTLYWGVLSTLIGQVPYGMLTFGSYEIYKDLLSKWIHRSNRLRIILAAVMGDVTGSLWLCPSEVVKSRLQAGQFPNMITAVKEIFSRQGIKGFYQGYAGQLARDIPFRAVQLLSYEELRWKYRQWKGKRWSSTEDLTNLENLLLGAIAGSFTAAITTPLDVLKTRMMTQQIGATNSPLYRGAADCVVQLVRQEGFQSLWKGLGPRVFYIGPSAAIFFAVYEGMKNVLLPKQHPH